MNIRNKGIAKRGAREIGSCVFKFIMVSYHDDDHISCGVTHVLPKQKFHYDLYLPTNTE